MISVLIGVLIIIVVGAICFWAIDKYANDRRLANLLKVARCADLPRRDFATSAAPDILAWGEGEKRKPKNAPGVDRRGSSPAEAFGRWKSRRRFHRLKRSIKSVKAKAQWLNLSLARRLKAKGK
jgi:hypothetical protein